MQHQEQTDATPAQILKSSFGIGAGTGAVGLVAGSLGGVLRSSHPVLFSVISGAQWFTVGSTFWFTRSILMQEINHDPSKKPFASAVSGAVSGAFTGALFRGRPNILPGAVVGTAVAFGGQHAYDAWERSTYVVNDNLDPSQTLFERFTRSKWSPLQYMSDEDYKDKLKSKLLPVDAELAVIDEELAELQNAKAKSVNKSEPQN